MATKKQAVKARKPKIKKPDTKTLKSKKVSPAGATSVFGPDLQKRMDYDKNPSAAKTAKTFGELREENPLVNEIGKALNEILDPEIGIGIVDLGLIYGVNLEKLPSGKYDAIIIMTLTSMGCPVGPMIMEQVESIVPQLVPSIESASVQIVWDPPWGPDRVKPEIRDMLFGF